jgi:TonB family protein
MAMDKNKRKALIGTLLFHAAVVVALLFMALRTPLPLPGEEGVEVNLGYADQGLGNRPVQPKVVKPDVKPVKKEVQKTPPPQPKPEPVKAKELTQNTEEAPTLEKKKPLAVKKVVKKEKKKAKVQPKPVDKKPLPKPEVKKETPKLPPQPVVNKRALFKVPVGTKARGEGINKGSSDQGKKQGNINSKSYTGRGGEGHGISFSLGNRGALYLDKPSSKFTEQGTVVVKIWVNPKGQVVKAMVYAKGTTVVDDSLRRMAVNAARNSSFSSDPTAPAEQIGTITYHFILKK